MSETSDRSPGSPQLLSGELAGDFLASVRGPEKHFPVTIRGRRLRARCLPGFLVRRARAELEINDPIDRPMLLLMCFTAAWPDNFWQMACSVIHPWFWPARWCSRLPPGERLEVLEQLLLRSEALLEGEG